jgi:hypothetical protein
MIPREYSSGERQRLGGLSKQGNPLLRFLWGEAGAHAVRKDPQLQRFYDRHCSGCGIQFDLELLSLVSHFASTYTLPRKPPLCHLLA